jgi:NAD(P)-dependent dehydrogenase (short-subunit alcohol dehydrogenase family)
VTGGASGIGLEIVRHLAGEGIGVVAVDRSTDACVRARASLAPLIDRVRLVEADIGTPEGAAVGIETAVKAFGRIDLLCNNAAVHPSETIAEHVLDTWREAFRVNVDGVMLCSQAALRHMIGAKRGAIVNIGSISGHAPYAGGGAYAATKAAVAMLTRVLALEAGPHGVTVNCIEPGTIRHRPGANLSAAHIPIGRAGTPTDVAALVSFLASDAAGYMNGAVITLDGGATAGRARVAKTR